MRWPIASVRYGVLANNRSCATCTRAPASPGSRLLPGAWRNAGSARNIWRCRSRRSRKGCCRGAREVAFPDIADDKGLSAAPGLVIVAAEADEAFEHQLARLEVDHFEFHPLHQRAHLVK